MAPFPSTRVIHARWSTHHQPVAEGGMTAKIRITIPGTGESHWDNDALQVIGPARTVLYAGPARVQSDFRPQDRQQADQATAVQKYLIPIPADVQAIPYGADVEIVECVNNAQFVGRHLFVDSITFASERFETDLICTETATVSTSEAG